MKLSRSPSLSVVVISRNEGDWLRETLNNLSDTIPDSGEIIVVDDGSRDGSTDFLAEGRQRARLIRSRRRGVSRSRNLGARASTGDVIVFADAHMRLPARWWRPLVDALRDPVTATVAPAVGDVRNPDSFGYGYTLPTPDLTPRWLYANPSKPFEAPVLPGCCLAMRRDVFESIGGFDPGLRSRGGIDAETSMRLWRLGYSNWIVPESKVWHYFRRCAPYDVTEEDVLHNRLRLAMVHLSKKRIRRVLRAYRDDPALDPALALVEAGGAEKRRRKLAETVQRSDDWFFERFELAW